jgi:uncharacterized protein YutE (UPF0331/DUF86 family)
MAFLFDRNLVHDLLNQNFDVDAEQIFMTLKEDLPLLTEVLALIETDVEKMN